MGIFKYKLVCTGQNPDLNAFNWNKLGIAWV